MNQATGPRKAYGPIQAVEEASLRIENGEIFGPLQSASWSLAGLPNEKQV